MGVQTGSIEGERGRGDERERESARGSHRSVVPGGGEAGGDNEAGIVEGVGGEEGTEMTDIDIHRAHDRPA